MAGSFGGTIGGNVYLVKHGIGIEALSGLNTRSGGTDIGDGALNINSDSALGAAACAVYLRPAHRARKVIRPRVRSYGESSTVTRSPGTILIQCFRIFPAM
jgi:hypothetical protein